MSKRQSRISQDERNQFRQAMQDVHVSDGLPVERKGVQHPCAPPGPMKNNSHESMQRPALAELGPAQIAATPVHLSYLGPGERERTLRRLRHGQYPTYAPQLDLHGLTVAQARTQLLKFLDHAAGPKARCLRIVHGKGLRSGQSGPVLKAHVAAWLKQFPQVRAFESAAPRDGGEGAVYVLLRRR